MEKVRDILLPHNGKYWAAHVLNQGHSNSSAQIQFLFLGGQCGGSVCLDFPDLIPFQKRRPSHAKCRHAQLGSRNQRRPRRAPWKPSISPHHNIRMAFLMTRRPKTLPGSTSRRSSFSHNSGVPFPFPLADATKLFPFRSNFD